MRNAFVAFAVLLVLLLAGCGGKSTPNSQAPEPTSSSTSSRPPSSTPSNPPPPPTGPGEISVSFTRSTPNGEVPLDFKAKVEATFQDASGHDVATPSGVSWTVTVDPAGGTTPASGASLPGDVSFAFATAGDYTATAMVKANGFSDGAAVIRITAAPPTAKPPLFTDGAETDASQFTITSNELVFVSDPLCGAAVDPLACAPTVNEMTQAPPPMPSNPPSQDVPKWKQDTSIHHTGAKSWWSMYPDNYRTRLTTISFTVPTGGADLSFFVKGGAESNKVDGLHVYSIPATGAAVLLNYTSGVLADWKEIHVLLPAGAQKIEFRFDADPSCSSETNAPANPTPPGGTSPILCGEGYDGGGIWLDDTLVKPVA